MLEGQTIELRAWRDEDLPTLVALRNDLELQNLLMAQARPNSVEKVRRWLVDKSGSEDVLFFVVGARDGGRCLGYLQLYNQRPFHGTAELGICLAPDAQGRGAGREALMLVEDYARRIFSIRKIILHVLADNPATGFYRRVGYREVGCLQAHARIDGDYRDVLIMERLLAP